MHCRYSNCASVTTFQHGFRRGEIVELSKEYPFALTLTRVSVHEARQYTRTAILLLAAPRSPGVLFQLRRYDEFIDAAQLRMIEEPNDASIRYLLGFAYVAVGEYQLAIHVLGSTGLPDTVLQKSISILSYII